MALCTPASCWGLSRERLGWNPGANCAEGREAGTKSPFHSCWGSGWPQRSRDRGQGRKNGLPPYPSSRITEAGNKPHTSIPWKTVMGTTFTNAVAWVPSGPRGPCDTGCPQCGAMGSGDTLRGGLSGGLVIGGVPQRGLWDPSLSSSSFCFECHGVQSYPPHAPHCAASPQTPSNRPMTAG